MTSNYHFDKQDIKQKDKGRPDCKLMLFKYFYNEHFLKTLFFTINYFYTYIFIFKSNLLVHTTHKFDHMFLTNHCFLFVFTYL